MAKTFNEWVKNHKEGIIAGAIVGGIVSLSIAIVAGCADGGTSVPKITHVAEPKFGPDVVTAYEDIDEAIFTDLAPEIEDHVMDLTESGKVTIERFYDMAGAGELGINLTKMVTVVIEDIVGD